MAATLVTVRPPAQNVNRGQQTRGRWVPQGDNWTLIHAVGKNQWVAGGVKGAKAPPKPKGPTPLPTNPMAPLTPNQIRRTATNTVKAAYAPNFTDLTNQAKTAQNLYTAQAADDAAFGKWLSDQTTAMNAKISGANASLANVLQGIQSTHDQAAQAQAGQLAQAQTSNPANGIVNQPGQMTAALQNDTAGSVGAGEAKVAGAVTQGVQNSIIQNLASLNAGDVGQARIQATKNLQTNALNTTLNQIANARTKTLTAETGDIAKEITRLQGVELSKAQWKVNEGALLSKVGASNANLASEVTARAANTTIQQARTKETARHNAAMEKINTSHYANSSAQAAARLAEQTRHNKAMEGLGQQRINQKGAGTSPTGVKFGTPTQQRAVVNYISKVQNALRTDIQRWHSQDPPSKALHEAYHDLASGRYAQFYGRLGTPPANADPTSYLNAAVNTLAEYGANGLTPGDIAFLNAQGLQVGSRYPRAGSGGTTQTGPGAGHR